MSQSHPPLDLTNLYPQPLFGLSSLETLFWTAKHTAGPFVSSNVSP